VYLFNNATLEAKVKSSQLINERTFINGDPVVAVLAYYKKSRHFPGLTKENHDNTRCQPAPQPRLESLT